jgi:hypothetical protein
MNPPLIRNRFEMLNQCLGESYGPLLNLLALWRGRYGCHLWGGCRGCHGRGRWSVGTGDARVCSSSPTRACKSLRIASISWISGTALKVTAGGTGTAGDVGGTGGAGVMGVPACRADARCRGYAPPRPRGWIFPSRCSRWARVWIVPYGTPNRRAISAISTPCCQRSMKVDSHSRMPQIYHRRACVYNG